MRSQLYGRKQSRPPGRERKAALDRLYPALCITDDHPLKIPPGPLWLEIGFGNGEHLDALMDSHPDVYYIGVEPFLNGMAAFLLARKEKDNSRLRVLMDDAIPLLHQLPDNSLDRLYVLNPDPWPKKRHHKRRIFQTETLNLFAKVLKPGGLLISSTDVDGLVEWIVSKCVLHPQFHWTARTKSDWETPPVGWPLITRYAAKGQKAGRTQRYFVFERL